MEEYADNALPAFLVLNRGLDEALIQKVHFTMSFDFFFNLFYREGGHPPGGGVPNDLKNILEWCMNDLKMFSDNMMCFSEK